MKTADGFDSCLIGKDSNHRAVYDADAMIEVLMMRDDMDREDAEDYFGSIFPVRMSVMIRQSMYF